jgi:Wiskott-Aldrich syndrome protein
VAPWAESSLGDNLSTAQLRERVEIAKQNYKREKELYRRTRDERRTAGQKERSPVEEPKTTDDEDSPNSPALAPISHMVSNARGPYPELEMISVPRSQLRSMSTGADAEAAAVRRITRRLTDMGFAEAAHPNIPVKIKELIASFKPVTKDGEDDIVTTLLEELLAKSPKPTPGPSGSGARDLPGAWH